MQGHQTIRVHVEAQNHGMRTQHPVLRLPVCLYQRRVDARPGVEPG